MSKPNTFKLSEAVAERPAVPATAETEGIVVLGMHRAGTSPVTNILVNFGFEVLGEVVPPGWDNPKGYWESREIVEIHDEFLHAIDHTWSDPRPLALDMFRGAAAERAREKLGATLARLSVSRDQWVLKDPRMCRLTPLWESVLDSRAIHLRFLHVLRSPLSVARSLHERDGFSEEKGLLLWLRHYLEAEAATRDQDRTWLHFEKLTAPAYVIERFRAVTGQLHFSVKRLQDVLGDVFDPSLVHYGLDFNVASENLRDHRWIARAYRALDVLGTAGEAEGRAELDELRAEIAAADSLFFGGSGTRTAEDHGERYYWLRKEMERYQVLVEAQRREIETQRAEVSVMRDAFEAERQRLEGLHQELADAARHQSQAAVESMAVRLDAVDQSVGMVAEQQGTAQHQTQEIAESLNALDRQSDQLDAVHQSVKTLAERQITAQHQGQEITESLQALQGQSQQLDAVRQVVDSEREFLVSISERTSAIERLITERLEQRHLTVLQKSLEVTAAIESQWAETRERLVMMTEERDSAAAELIEACRQRDDNQKEVDLLLARKSWRLTSPLRWMYRVLRGGG